MEEGNLKPANYEKKKERDSSPEESGVMSRYIDLKAASRNPLMSKDERKQFSQGVIDLVNILNAGKGISQEFREDLFIQLQKVEDDYLSVKKAAEAVHELERESRRGVLAPHLYEKAIDLIAVAMNRGVSPDSLEPLRQTIREYLTKVWEQQHGQK